MPATFFTHYDDSYFTWQRSGGEFSAVLDRWKFEGFIKQHDVVLDFGCGGGFLLASLTCKARYGIEVNPAAQAEAKQRIEIYTAIEEVPEDLQFDVIISHHALEHVANPMDVLQKLCRRLKPGGKVIVVVPAETWQKEKVYQAGDINQHLYTWTPRSAGNLFTHAGFIVERVDLLCHRWLPLTGKLYRRMPDWLYHWLCRGWAKLSGRRQLRIVASRPAKDREGGA